MILVDPKLASVCSMKWSTVKNEIISIDPADLVDNNIHLYFDAYVVMNPTASDLSINSYILFGDALPIGTNFKLELYYAQLDNAFYSSTTNQKWYHDPQSTAFAAWTSALGENLCEVRVSSIYL